MNDTVHIPFLNALIDPNDNFARKSGGGLSLLNKSFQQQKT
ncbi:hypothetical protein N9I19_21485 [Peribacillus sp. CSMR9]|nr:hypothetical protein [Peribacillus sp. CSMR9]